MELFGRDGKLDEDVQEVLYELGNVGVGMASVTIGRLLGVRIELASPNVIPVTEVSDQTLLTHIGEDDAGIWMHFAEPMRGLVLFILNRSFVYDVVDKMTGKPYEGEQLYQNEIAFSAVTEFANMLSAAYMKAVGKYTNLRIFLSPYMFVFGNVQIMLGDTLHPQGFCADQAIWVETRFQLLEEDPQTEDAGRVIMLPDDDTVEMLINALEL